MNGFIVIFCLLWKSGKNFQFLWGMPVFTCNQSLLKVFFKIRFQKFNTVNFPWSYFHHRVIGALMSAKEELSYQNKVSPWYLYSIYKYPLQITCFILIKYSQYTSIQLKQKNKSLISSINYHRYSICHFLKASGIV